MRSGRQFAAALEEASRLRPDWFEGWREPPEPKLRAKEPDPAEFAEAGDEFKRLIFAIEYCLNPHWQYAMICTLQGNTPEQVAEKMSLPLYGVKLMIEQAAEELRQLLADDDDALRELPVPGRSAA